jgi:DNA-binding response OmpR family regulator
MRILIVEDEKKLADALTAGLMKKGHAVDTLGDGEKAFNRLSMHHEDYDLVILDLMLPGMPGDVVCKKIRELGITLPILILTARNETEIKVDLLLSGADDYVVKPFSFDELTARIQALARRPSEKLPEKLALRDIELNPAEHTVTRAGEPVNLTLKEFSLLEYFMRHPNQVINREELLSHLWDFNYESFSNVIDVHVKNLRRKLGGEEGTDLLETVRGIGYRIHP